MNAYIHSHLSYDQIITDSADETVPQEQQTRIKIYKQKDKPFRIERSSRSIQNATNSTKKFKPGTEEGGEHQNPETLPTNNDSNARAEEDNNEKQVKNEYESDFQFYEQDIEESIVNQFKISRNDQTCELAATRKNKNYSAVLPRIGRMSTQKQKKSERYTEMSNERNRIMKSTIELREENKKLVRDIEQFRKFLPLYKKNQLIISMQSQQLSKIKARRSKFFDINYQLSLDRNVSQNTSDISQVQDRIKAQQSHLKYQHQRRKYNAKNGKVKFSRVRQEHYEEECELISQLTKLREHVLSKKRQEEQYGQKIVDLDSKIQQYQQLLLQLQQRSKIGIHEQLKRRKIVLQYDIQMKRSQYQEKECQLIVQITELNNRSSQLEIKCSQINSQLSQIARRRIQSKAIHDKNKDMPDKIEKNNKQQVQTDEGPKKTANRLIRLFGRKK